MADKNRLENNNTSGNSGSNKKTTKAVATARRMSAQNPGKKNQKKGGVREYWKGVKTELGKVIWPTPRELGTYTVVVIVTCAVFALAFWLMDTGFLAVMKAVLGVSL